MSEQNYDELLEIPKIVFKFIGIKFMQSKSDNIVDHMKNHWIFYAHLIWLYSCVVGEFVWMADDKRDDLGFIELTYTLPCIAQCLLGSFKGFSMLIYADDLKNLYDCLLAIPAEYSSGDKSNERDLTEKDLVTFDANKGSHVKQGANLNGLEETGTKAIVDESMIFLRAVLKFLTYLNVLTIATFNLSPLFMTFFVHKQKGVWKWFLPYIIMYPFKIDRWSHYLLAYIHQSLATFEAVSYAYGPDSLFIIACTVISMNFKILKYHMERMVPVKVCRSRNFHKYQDLNVEVDEELLKHRYRELVKRHQLLMRLVTQLEKVYARAFLFNFTTSSFIICLTVFNATTISDKGQVFCHLSFFLTSFFQIFTLCYFGDMIMTSSAAIGEAMFNCQWYHTKKETKINVLTIISRAQNPCKLSALKFADVNLAAFTKILSSAYSYFTLLQTMYTPGR